jgi:hypothetical protein
VLGRQALYSAIGHFCSVYFGDRVLLFVQAGLDYDPILYTSCRRWDDVIHHHPTFFFLLRWGLLNFFA